MNLSLSVWNCLAVFQNKCTGNVLHSHQLYVRDPIYPQAHQLLLPGCHRGQKVLPCVMIRTPLCLLLLKNFSCAHWPCEYLLWANIYSILCSFYIEAPFYYSVKRVLYTFCTHCLITQDVKLFYLLWTNVFSFDEVQFIIFFFHLCLWWHIQKIIPNPRSLILCLHFILRVLKL